MLYHLCTQYSSRWKLSTHIYEIPTSISQLLADHGSISVVPEVITHCSPLVIDAHLHSTLILIGASHQTNISIGTVTTKNHCSEKSYAVGWPLLCIAAVCLGNINWVSVALGRQWCMTKNCIKCVDIFNAGIFKRLSDLSILQNDLSSIKYNLHDTVATTALADTITVSSLKYTIFFITTLSLKWRGGIYWISLDYTPQYDAGILMNAVALQRALLVMYYGKSAAPVLIPSLKTSK